MCLALNNQVRVTTAPCNQQPIGPHRRSTTQQVRASCLRAAHGTALQRFGPWRPYHTTRRIEIAPQAKCSQVHTRRSSLLFVAPRRARARSCHPHRAVRARVRVRVVELVVVTRHLAYPTAPPPAPRRSRGEALEVGRSPPPKRRLAARPPPRAARRARRDAMRRPRPSAARRPCRSARRPRACAPTAPPRR